MFKYYSEKLTGERLALCYKLAPPPVKQFLHKEIQYIISKIQPNYKILELGCGYGRVLKHLALHSNSLIGIDNSFHSLYFGKNYLKKTLNCQLMQMNAINTGLKSNLFDLVLCIQNGMSAFHVNKADLLKECIRLTKRGGIVLLSSYSEKFWEHRLKWFEIQSQNNLIGEIDYTKTGNGVIICKDGFSATTVSRDEFRSLANSVNQSCVIKEVAESSIFCEIQKS